MTRRALGILPALLLAGTGRLSAQEEAAPSGTIRLRAGWNLVAVSSRADMPRSASELARRIDAENSPGTVGAIRALDVGDLPAYPQADFALEPGRAYFVLATAPASWTFLGDASLRAGTAILGPGGTLWIAAPAGRRAAEVAREVEAGFGACVRFVRRWNGNSWETYVVGMPFGNFVTREGEGVVVLAGNATR